MLLNCCISAETALPHSVYRVYAGSKPARGSAGSSANQMKLRIQNFLLSCQNVIRKKLCFHILKSKSLNRRRSPV